MQQLMREDGQSLVEFALVLALLLTLDWVSLTSPPYINPTCAQA